VLLAEVYAEGGKVLVVARPHNIPRSLLYNWRSVRNAAAAEDVAFIPAVIIKGPVLHFISAAAPLAPERELELAANGQTQ
jgi:hypothetical protein